jgi:hypothetical protein
LSRPSTNLFLIAFLDVDARHEAGHDESEIPKSGISRRAYARSAPSPGDLFCDQLQA